MYVKAFIVHVKKRLKPFFLEQHINIVNRVTLQSLWFIFTFCIEYIRLNKGVIKRFFHTQPNNPIRISMMNTTSERLLSKKLIYLVVF